MMQKIVKYLAVMFMVVLGVCPVWGANGVLPGSGEETARVIDKGEYPKFVWSEGSEEYTYLNLDVLAGMDEIEAVSYLENYGVNVSVEYDYSNGVVEGTVIHYKSDKVILREPEPITIVVSQGEYDWSENVGDGTAVNPYQISKPGMLFSMNCDEFHYYSLMTDIDLQYYEFNQCVVRSECEEKQFIGVFDGNGRTLSNIDISIAYDDYYEYDCMMYNFSCVGVGVFSVVTGQGSVVRNLGVKAVKVDVNEYCNSVGGFAGFADTGTNIYNCYAKADIYSESNPIIIGGFVGFGYSVDSCYSDCLVETDSLAHAGGFSGMIYLAENCYARGSIIAESANYAGGFSGSIRGSVVDCYSLVYSNDYISTEPFVSNGLNGEGCFWDYEVCGEGLEPHSFLDGDFQGISTAEMQSVVTFTEAGWAITDDVSNGSGEAVWYISEGSYPELIWENHPGYYSIGSQELLGFDQRAVTSRLDAIGVEYVINTDYSDYPAGAVCIVNANERICTGDSVRLVVSLGEYDWSMNPGDGSEENPWQLSSVWMVHSVREDMFDDHFIVTEDIDFTDYEFINCVFGGKEYQEVLVFPQTDFTGVFDGGGHVLSNLNYVMAGTWPEESNKMFFWLLL